MLQKPDKKYGSRSAVTRIAKMCELISERYSSLRKDMTVQVYKLAALIEQLRSIRTIFNYTLAVGILVASIHVDELASVKVSINTLVEEIIAWEAISYRLT